MLQVSQLGRPGLGPIDFTLESGHCLAVTGPSGAGKSLLLRAIADLDPNDGTVRAGDVERRSLPAPQWRGLVGMVPAESGWWADVAGDHFAEPQRAIGVIELLGLPGEALDWQVARLSTGERHRLALARALSLEPEVLLLDEPTAALDEQATGNVETVLRQRMAGGTTIVMVTHDAAQVGRIAHSVMRLKDGKAEPPECVS